MSLPAALLLAQIAAPPELPVPEASDSEIVVIGRKLAETRVDWSTRRRNGTMQIRRCRVTHTSGDSELDRVVCRAMRECAPRIPPDSRLGDPLPEFFACTHERSMAFGLELVDRREAAADGAR